MGDLISLDLFRQEDFSKLEREQLMQRLEAVRLQIARLDEEEPADMMSEAYEAWGDAHEELEDMEDELLDLLDGMI